MNLGNIQFSSVTQSYPNLCDPMNRSMPGLPVHHQLPELELGLPDSSTSSLLLRAWILQVFEMESLLKMEK